jgi:O-antigen/teichoic acid export membrane protein
MGEMSAASRGHLGQVARGGTLGMVGAAVSAVAGFALAVLVTRGLSPADAGIFFACTSVFLMVASISSLGTDTGLARFLIRHEANGRSGDLVSTFKVAAVPALSVAVVAAVALEISAAAVADALGAGQSGTVTLRILAPVLPLAVAADVALSGTRAFGWMRQTVVIDRFVRAGLQPVAVVLSLLVGGGVAAIAAGWASAYAVSAGLALIAARRCFRARSTDSDDRRGRRLSRSPIRAVGREFWGFTWPRGVTRASQMAIQKSDIVIVAVLLSPADAAFYTAATRFVALGQFATQAFQQVLQPRFTAILVHDDVTTLREVYRVATGWNLIVTWPVYLVVGCAPAVYLTIFGDAYAGNADGQLVVVTMAGAMLLAVASGPVDTLLLMAGRSRTSMANALVALCVDIALCFVLVPALGIAGAGLAWAAAVTTRCSLAFAQVRRSLGVSPGGVGVGVAAALPLVCVGLPVLAVTSVAPANPLAWSGAVVTAGVLYLMALWRFRHVLRLDLLVEALRSTTGRRAGRQDEGVAGMSRLRKVSSKVRGALPARVVVLLRRIALRWGMLTAGLRMRPAFVIVGAQRSGTTTLFRLLESHPNLVRPTLSKGTGYFDDLYCMGPRWYRAHFPLRPVARVLARGEVATFECSGYYLFHPLAAERIARDLPGVKIVVMLRDPVARAHSAYRHELARGFENLGFDDAVALESMRVAGEAERLLEDPDYRSFEHRHHAYLGRGEYGDQVRRLVEAVGPARVHVVEADTFFADPEAEFVRLQRWLELPIWLPPSVGRWNAQPGAPLAEEVRASLMDRFAEQDAVLAGLLGHAPAWRNAEVSR